MIRPARALVAIALAGAALSWAGPAGAQEVVDVKGVVADTAGDGIKGAMVVVLALPDSVLTKFALSDGDGHFTLSRVPAGSYVLQVTMVGHQTVRKNLTVAADPVDAGTIKLEVLAIEMDELVVSVDHVPFVNRRDTLDYNAAAFATRPNATVEELLARLPGIEVDSDGTIRAQGEQVENVLVDGKEFFGGDPTVATRNLPADAVERVQVYDKESDMAEFTGIADGQEERTINLQLREEARTGYFGQVAGGLGAGLEPTTVSESQPTGRTRYTNTFNINRFSPSTQLALLGGANNVNQGRFGAGSVFAFGGPAGIEIRGGGGGFSSSMSIGANASRDFSDDRWIRTSYFYAGVDNTTRRVSNEQQLLGSSVAAFESASSEQVSDNATHRFDANAQYELEDGHDLRLRGGLNMGSSSRTSSQSSTTQNLEHGRETTGTSSNVVDGSTFSGRGSLTWRKRLNDAGRAIVGTADLNVSEPETHSDLGTNRTVMDDDGVVSIEDVLQQQRRTGRTLSFSQRLSLTQPIGPYGVLELYGRRYTVDENQDNSVFDVGSGTPIRNDRQSSGFERLYGYIQGGARLGRNVEALRLSLRLQVQRSKLEGRVLERDERIRSGYTHVLPSLDVRYELDEGKNVRFRYSTSTREPSMNQLQPYTDNANPVRTYVGNPNLQPEYRHAVNAEYRSFDQFSFTNLFAYLRFSYTRNDIVTARFIDEETAIQTSMPVNVDRSWTSNGRVTYGRPIRPIGARLNVNYGLSLGRSVELINEQENEGSSWRHSIDASIDNRDKDVFDVRAGARFGFNDVEYSLNEELGRAYLDRTFYGNGTLHFWDGWTASSRFNYRLYDDDVFGAADRNVAMWNASISKRALEDRVEVQLTAFDLLDQNKGVTYQNGPSYLREQRTESLGRYVMLNVTYRMGRPGGARRGLRGPR